MTKWRLSTALAVLAAALFTFGCDSTTDPGQPAVVETEASSSSLLGDLGSELSIAQRSIALLTDEVVRKKIGTDGGSLSIGGHTLTVPAGAVDRPTVFVMAVLAGTEIVVELIAYDPDLYVDVGGKGFNVPVQLALSYAELGDVNPEDLTIVHVKSDGTKERLETDPIPGTTQVGANLDHFSRYALCRN